MTTETALQARWDQERRQITEAIRTFGVHLTYVPPVGSAGTGMATCCGCRAAGPADDGGELPDPFADLLLETGGDPASLPPRADTPFCYTTGLFGVGHAELAVVGLDRLRAAEVLDAAALRVLDEGLDLMPGEVVELEGTSFLVEELGCSGMVFFETHSFYDRPAWASLAAYQLTWADDQGRFPWDEGHEAGPWPQPRAGRWRA
ncbi:DUF4262 domain-containing protein [Ornithinimicrobium cerasi]|uniref:DUF4262 domain-containing protein n=1 Tax=Ornithinimicrobium cerasi TaxID=2248773 RepID=UPI000EFE44DA|nr:DUF4262 domain-containing protein [Ornithinimicrobium cerasi]